MRSFRILLLLVTIWTALQITVAHEAPQEQDLTLTGEDSDAQEDQDSDKVANDATTKTVEKSPKEIIEKRLNASIGSIKKAMRLAKKHQAKITIAVAVFAFREEMFRTLRYLLMKDISDPRTGRLRVSPKMVLKIIVLADLLRKLQSGDMTSQPTFQTLLALAQTSPLLGMFFSKVARIPLYNPTHVPPITQHYTFERLNERYLKDGMALQKAIHSKHEGFKWPGAEPVITRSLPSDSNLTQSDNSEMIVVMDLTDLDSSVSTMDDIRDQVSFLLSQYRLAAMTRYSTDEDSKGGSDDVQKMEVVVLLESGGGTAEDYGLAAEQLLRLRNDHGITLTICVDRVAASGGYMMACTSSPGQLLAAPMAVVGSIGALGILVNFHSLLEKWGLTPLVLRAGKNKVPLAPLGEVTQQGKDLEQAVLDNLHRAFLQHVVSARPVLERKMNEVGNGDVWRGTDALKLGLVDRICSSDEYICRKVADGARVLKMVRHEPVRSLFGYGHLPSGKKRYGTSLADHAGTAFSRAASHIGGAISGALSRGRCSNPALSC